MSGFLFAHHRAGIPREPKSESIVACGHPRRASAVTRLPAPARKARAEQSLLSREHQISRLCWCGKGSASQAGPGPESDHGLHPGTTPGPTHPVCSLTGEDMAMVLDPYGARSWPRCSIRRNGPSGPARPGAAGHHRFRRDRGRYPRRRGPRRPARMTRDQRSRPSMRIAFRLRILGRISGLMSSCPRSLSQRSGVSSG